MEHLEKVLTEIAPDSPFEPIHLKSELEELYQGEVRTADILLLFTILSIIIGCLGLFGLTAFLIEKRTKEIGVRKVLGATTGQLVRILSWDFIKLIFVSIVISCPVAYVIMNNWLDNFAYHITINIAVFAFTALVAIFISFSTVFYHSYKAAVANPADAIRNE